MKGKILKKLNEKTPDFIKKYLSIIIRYKVISNKVFKTQIEEINNFDKKNIEEKTEIHIKKLKETLIYAYENTNYYKRIFDEIELNVYKFNDLKQMKNIPLIDKAFVLENFEDLISKEEIDYYEAYTGGSTGKPLRILLDTDSIYK
jgi:phenylacetate-CoA ligase